MKNNLSQSKTNNESNFFTNNNDINIYLNKYIFNKKKTRNRENNLFFNKKTFNLSSQKYDINGSINIINNTCLNNNPKIYNFNKNFFTKSRNKIPSYHKGRPNTIINKNKKLLNNNQKDKKQNSKEKKDLSTNLKNKKRNYSMIGYSNLININLNNNMNQNLTDRDNIINIKDNTMNKSQNGHSKKTRHNKVLSGIYINLSNLGHITKKEINSERNNKMKLKNTYIRIMSKNKSNYSRQGAFLRHNAFYKAKLSFVSSHSVSKSKSNVKKKKKNKNMNNNKIIVNQNLQSKRNKSNFSNTLIEDLSKLKNINKKPKKIIQENKKGKKLSKDIVIDIFQKKIVGRNQKNNSNFGGGNVLLNNNEKYGPLTSRTRNLKTYNIFFKTNSIDIDKNKIIELNNKENFNINRKSNNNNIINNSNQTMKKNCSNVNDILKVRKNSDNYMKKMNKKNILKNNIEKASNDNNIFIPLGIRKFYSGKKAIKNK